VETTEAKPRPDQAFHVPVVFFQDVVEKRALSQSGEASQLTICFHLCRGTTAASAYRAEGQTLVVRDEQ
jgi:hypothetical protein